MPQRYHSNATTNVRLRREIHKGRKSNTALCMQYGVLEKTVCKWQSRDKFTDKSSRPKAITYALSDLEQSIAINLRRILGGH